ncbi:MAG: tyrosine-type recombinase/integrase [Pseudonocardiaceae bacterium]
MLFPRVKTCESEWLFPPSRYGPPNRTALVWAWEQTCPRAGVTNVTMHTLRHFAASGLIAGGVDVVSVQRVLGHSTPTTTLRVYSDYWAEAEDRTRQATANLMSFVTSPDHPQSRRTTSWPVETALTAITHETAR